MENSSGNAEAELAALFCASASLEDRQANAIERRALIVHGEMLREWGSRDDGDLPTLDDALARATDEIEILCDALGSLAEHRASTVFPRQEGRRRPLRHD